jgi:putative Mg2+ transporter-C (MgtC) family protein
MIGVNSFGGEDAQARALQGLLSGLGFLGGGAILKQEDHVSGTACAATIWVVGALGAAVGFGAYKIALSLSLLAWFVLGSLKRFKRGRGPDDGASDAPIDA